MRTFNNPDRNSWSEILKRPLFDVSKLYKKVQFILAEIRNTGDKALLEYTAKFDRVKLDSILVSESEVATADSLVSEELKGAIKLASGNIKKFHISQKTEINKVETMPGVNCWQKSVGIEKVGLYIPGGTAPLFSTVLMLAIPARIAGCKEIIICTPPDKNGNINPAILFTAKICGIDKIYKVGGIQAIGALTYGTESIPQVYKIFGPGNQFVTVAKQIASNQGVAIDMPAGPSELLVVADDSCIPEFVASDLFMIRVWPPVSDRSWSHRVPR